MQSSENILACSRNPLDASIFGAYTTAQGTESTGLLAQHPKETHSSTQFRTKTAHPGMLWNMLP
jgi:hypothetical protein